ncbi:MAG: OmpH family outer membrane protein [Amylibacter sp.]|nr:OmpH family outer membrane protein [Amylibacter sp.]
MAADLEREERELTDVRKTIASGEFSILAKAFDEKVKAVRRRQDQKAIELAQALEGAKFRFFNEAEQMITQLMKDNGIVFVLDESAVWIAQGGDITKLIITRLDAAFQAGQLPLE